MTVLTLTAQRWPLWSGRSAALAMTLNLALGLNACAPDNPQSPPASHSVDANTRVDPGHGRLVLGEAGADRSNSTAPDPEPAAARSSEGAPTRGPDDGGTDAPSSLADVVEMPECPTAADPSAVRARADDLGASGPRAGRPRRQSALSAQVGDRLLWIFNEPDGSSIAWGKPGDDAASLPQLDDDPDEFVQLLPAGAGLDETRPWVASAVARGDGEALLFLVSLYLLAPTAAGLARIARDARQAEVLQPAGAMWKEHAPGAFAPKFVAGPVVVDTDEGRMLYLYACHPDPSRPDEQAGAANANPCRLARVPLEHAADEAQYRFWNGSAFTADVHTAVPVLSGVGGSHSVSYNRYLGKYLSVASGLGNDIVLRIADRPEGEWQVLAELETLDSPGSPPELPITFGGREHVALRSACHDVIYVSYDRHVRENDGSGGTTVADETRLVRVTLE